MCESKQVSFTMVVSEQTTYGGAMMVKPRDLCCWNPVRFFCAQVSETHHHKKRAEKGKIVLI